jgi:hypothetical protein
MRKNSGAGRSGRWVSMPTMVLVRRMPGLQFGAVGLVGVVQDPLAPAPGNAQ